MRFFLSVFQANYSLGCKTNSPEFQSDLNTGFPFLGAKENERKLTFKVDSVFLEFFSEWLFLILLTFRKCLVSLSFLHSFHSVILLFTFLLFGLKTSFMPQTGQTACGPLLIVYPGTLYIYVGSFSDRLPLFTWRNRWKEFKDILICCKWTQVQGGWTSNQFRSIQIFKKENLLLGFSKVSWH